MTGVSVAERLAAGGLQEHMFSQPTAVAEACSPNGATCIWDSDCCSGLVCEWWECETP
ncbi:hypothetical protein [Streptomyces sp. A5-4]|uniref:hypothetical protein n=1 Tax=Streptomyces sp. A5-4 TaxID=3384771 RepID=UPI003DAA429A